MNPLIKCATYRSLGLASLPQLQAAVVALQLQLVEHLLLLILWVLIR